MTTNNVPNLKTFGGIIKVSHFFFFSVFILFFAYINKKKFVLNLTESKLRRINQWRTLTGYFI